MCSGQLRHWPNEARPRTSVHLPSERMIEANERVYSCIFEGTKVRKYESTFSKVPKVLSYEVRKYFRKYDTTEDTIVSYDIYEGIIVRTKVSSYVPKVSSYVPKVACCTKVRKYFRKYLRM